MDDRTRGIYNKFIVQRVDGEDGAGRKHENCFYFVLDTNHDRHALKAVKAYADSCRDEYPVLAKDLEALLFECEQLKGAI